MTEENITENVTTTGGCDPVINGTVTVNEYGHVNPLEGASVVVNSTSGHVLASTTTDANGYYSLSFYSTDTTFNVIVSYMGCTSLTRSVTVTNGPDYPTDPNLYGTANFELTPKSATLRSTGNGETVYIQGQNKDGFAGVINVRVDGVTYIAYCIDLFTPISMGDTLLVNGPLPGTAGDLPSGVDWGKVTYILNHYNPSSDTEAAAIQCAIWYFTSAPYGTYNSAAPVGTYYQFMTAPSDGVIRNWWGYDYTVRNRAWTIINEAISMQYPYSITVTPETTTVANGQTVTVTATVRDIDGNPLQGVTVYFQRTSGSLSRTSGTTDVNGQVSTILTLANNSNSVVTAYVSGNYGNLLYDDQYASTRKQNLVARNVLPLTISAFSIINTAPTANVALSQTATSPVNVGDTVTYTVTATNNGPNTATGILIFDTVPAGLSGVTITPSVGTYYNGVWTIPTLANGASATLTITGTATAAMAGLNTTNTATRTSQEQYNNQPATTTATVYTKLSDPIITQTVNGQSTGTVTVNVGDDVTFVVNAYCSGPDDATNIQISDIIPAGLENYTVTPSVGTYDSNTGIWTIAFLEKFTSATLTIVGKAGAAMAGTIITNHAEEIYQTEYNPYPGNSTSIPVYTKLADVTISQTGSYLSNVVTFIVTVTNNGPDTATNINIEDIIPAGLTGVTVTPSIGSYDSNTGIWTIPELLNGVFTSLTITGTATPQITVTNTVNKTSQSEYDPNTPNISTTDIYVPQVDVYIIRHVPWYYNAAVEEYQYVYTAGNTPVFYVMISNSNNYDDATNVIVEYTIGTGYTYQGHDTQGIGTVTYNDLTRTLTWTIDHLPKGGIILLKVFTGCTESGTMTEALTNNVKITHVDQFDANTENNNATCALTINPSADIGIDQTYTTSTENETQYVTYTITATNNGPNNATGVTVTDKLPTELTYYKISLDEGNTWVDSDPSYNPTTGTWTIGTFNYGETPKVLMIKAIIIGTGTIKNTATKTQTGHDWNLDNNSKTTILTLSGTYNPTTDVSIIRHVPWYYNAVEGTYQYSYTAGNTPVFYVMISNSNNYDDATNVIVEYTIGTGYTYQGHDTQGIGTVTYNDLTRTLTWTIDHLPKGGIILLKVFTGCTESGTMTEALTNNVKITHVDQFDANTENNNATCALTINPSADIGIDQTYTTSTENETQYVTYTITATNNGPNNATGVTVTDKLPTELTYYKISLDEGNTWVDSDPSYNPTTGTWTIGTFNYGETPKVLMIKAIIIGTGTIKNTATKTQTGHDWNLDNNSKTIYIYA
ncbi:Ig-like domain-containing protein [Methanobacterium ferruginis]|uniref:Ig-like domain-containing protein n=1 Tax=Methanobacterium ferruginis TaxID=710191 RepID=UPI002573F824|nr:Ig-like domain-containing protein [Methanobacterium ferruginis]BDZ69013.1 hypothetical protein GCM10025860_24610 [Methanobacterium ferruginis]